LRDADQATIDQQHSIEIIAAKNVNKSCYANRPMAAAPMRFSRGA
jgi:hypothetical protein